MSCNLYAIPITMVSFANAVSKLPEDIEILHQQLDPLQDVHYSILFLKISVYKEFLLLCCKLYGISAILLYLILFIAFINIFYTLTVKSY